MDKKLAKIESEAKKCLEETRECYRQMQRNWFMFAKHVKIIRDKNYCDYVGDESFIKLCEREFPLTGYATISKYIQIVEKIGDQIESRLKEEEYRLPSFETCYQLTSIREKVPATDFDKLQKEVLDDKLTVRSFRDKISALISTAKKQLRDKIELEADIYIEKTQRELDKELREDLSWSGDEDDSDLGYSPEGLDIEDVEVEEDEDSEEFSLIERMDYIEENLGDYVSSIEGSKSKSFSKRLKRFQTIINNAISALE